MVTEEIVPIQDLLEFLSSYGGAWMWDNLQMPTDTGWTKAGPRNRTLLCVTGGSYTRHVYPDISEAGWIIQCRATGIEVKGSFAERLAAASSYRGKMMGMLAIHVFLLAVEEFHGE